MAKGTGLVVRVRRTSDGAAPWLVSDRALTINQFIPPAQIPSSVRRVMVNWDEAFFYAVRDDAGRIVFGIQAPLQATW
jgi:hypothetical protein